MASFDDEAKAGAPRSYSVGIAGATGAVGKEMVSVLATRGFPVSSLHLFASARSAGTKLDAGKFGEITVEEFTLDAGRKVDVMFLAVSGAFAKAHARALAADGGPVVIDNSSALRLEEDVPLVVPEINAAAARAEGVRLVANPNCTTAIAAVALWPLHQTFGLQRVLISSYQAASGAGAEGMEELKRESEVVLGGGRAGHKIFSHPLAFNVIPHIDTFQDNGYTREEMKVVWETRKIFGARDLAVSCTAVRVPTLRAHAEAIVVETAKPATADAARAVLATSPGVEVVDDPAAASYPMPLHASEKYNVEVGRLRSSLIFGERGLEFFVCGDQLLKGAALNAVQIAECMLLVGESSTA